MSAKTAHTKSVQSPLVNGLLALLGVYGMFGSNPLEWLWAVLLLYFILRKFWWANYPGIILFCLLTPFLEIHTVLIEAANYGLTLDQLYPETGQLTFWLASFGLFSLLLGFTAGLRKTKVQFSLETLRESAHQISQRNLLLATLGLAVGGIAIDIAIPYSSPIRQIETYYAGMTNACYMTFAIHFWITRKNPWLAIALFLVFLATSFQSYFSSWREPFTIALVSILVTYNHFKIKHLLRLSPLLIPVVALTLMWQTVKSDYRAYLSQGERAQIVRVGQLEALTKFSELVTEATTQDAVAQQSTINNTLKRAGYVEYFNATVRKVPAEIPHENGRLLAESLSFAFIPRILNPDKGVKNDRLKVERYTDFYFGASSFSSFSLGHYCEAYIDWGPVWMMLHLFIYGFLGALLIRISISKMANFNPIVAMGILWIIILPWGTFQQDMIVVAGKTVWGALCHLVLFWPLYKLINRHILTSSLNQ